MKKKIAVIGAGLSGVTVVNRMKEKFDIEIFEKSRGVGGRMSTRKEIPYIFDHGAQFFRIKSIEFKNFVSDLFSKNIIQPWEFKLAHFTGNKLKKIKSIKNGDKFYVGVPNMDSIVKYISRNYYVNLNTKIKKLMINNYKWYLLDQNKKSHGPYDWIILSLPAKQSLELLTKNVSFFSLVEKIKMKSCFSLMVGISDSLCLGYDAALIENRDIAWLAINNSKPLRTKKYCLVVNSSFEFADKNINSPKDEVLKHLLDVTSRLINYDLSNVSMAKLHQWMYVEAKNSPIENYFIDHEKKIAVCGDWLINSRVEGAFVSANELSKEIIKVE